MHICFISSEYPPETGWGGIGSYTYEMAHGLVALGHRVSVISQATDAPGQRDDGGVRVIRVRPAAFLEKVPLLWRLNRHLPRFAYAAARAFKKLHRADPIDLIEAAEFDAESLFLHGPGRPPVVVRLHTARRIIDRYNENPPGSPMRYAYEQSVLARAAALSAPSEAIGPKTFDALGIPPRPVTVIPNPIHAAAFGSPATLTSRKTVLFVGRMEQLKVRTLVEALPIVFEGCPGLTVRFVGNDGLRPDGLRWSSYACRLVPERCRNQLHFGRVPRDELPEIMAAAGLAVFASRWENFPYVLLETMAAGTPAIVATAGGMTEIVTDGVDGFHLRENTPACVAETILRAMARPKALAEMGRRAAETVATRFDTAVIAPKMAAFYESVRSAS